MLVQGDGRPKLCIFAKCANLIREIIGYQWPHGSATRNPADIPMPVNDHALDALRYLLASDQGGFGRASMGSGLKIT
ncbi:hypothetical protein ACI3PL_21975, partial [Lacticaseibacillus paracasei]